MPLVSCPFHLIILCSISPTTPQPLSEGPSLGFSHAHLPLLLVTSEVLSSLREVRS